MTVAVTNPGVEKNEFVKLELRTAYGPVYRNVSTQPPREARSDEIPIIDLTGIDDGSGTKHDRIVREIKQASENIGFFYIANHGIPTEIIDNAREVAITFFKQPEETKMRVSKSRSKHFNGYHANGMSKVSRTEGSRFDPFYVLLTTHLVQWTIEKLSCGNMTRSMIQRRKTCLPFQMRSDHGLEVRISFGMVLKIFLVSKILFSHTGKNV